MAQEGKPEHLGMISYTNNEADKRLEDYKAIAIKTETLYKKIPARLKDAFYQLVVYPVKGAYLMNQKILFAKQRIDLAKQGKEDALQYGAKAEAAYKEIQSITATYNKTIAGGEWDGMMSCHPRNLEVFKMPKIATKQIG